MPDRSPASTPVPAAVLACAAVALVPAVIGAQAVPVPDTATSSTVLLENEHVLVVENRYPPGSAGPSHTHRWPRSVYVVEGGVLELVGEGGVARRVELRPGQTLWRPAETHRVRNPGSTTVVVVETEVKGAGGASPAEPEGRPADDGTRGRELP